MVVSRSASQAAQAPSVTARHDRQHRFVVQRRADAHGFYYYAIENLAQQQRIDVPRALFDRFRAGVRRAARELAGDPHAPLSVDVRFKGEPRFSVVSPHSGDRILLRAYAPGSSVTTSLSVSRPAMATLDRLLYDPGLRHPNELLNRIVTYHKLFQFTFVDGSESLTSNLILRRDVLAHVERYLPALGQRAEGAGAKDDAADPPEAVSLDPSKRRRRGGLFKSRLAERDGERNYQVNYESLFTAEAVSTTAKTPRTADDLSDGGDDDPGHSFPMPLLASDIKRFHQVPFRAELGPEDIKRLRKMFVGDRDSEFYLGFEMLDCIFRSHGQLKTFRFPLYYLPVALEESGRVILLRPLEGPRVYLNHLALANLVETFAPGGTRDWMDEFFGSLLSHTFEVSSTPGRIHLARWLPHADEVFDRTREILLGFPGENGKGGLLGELKVNGIESDLESVMLYKAARPTSATAAALEADLDHIVATSEDDPDRFRDSLLGSFLGGEDVEPTEPVPFAETHLMPGAQPKSIRTLLDRMNQHDLVLLEGPPGTGKTFTIANLLIHCVATGKRVLVVSDQMAAIHALTERIQDYLLGRDRDSPRARDLDLLWRMGIKVIDEIPSPNANLASWVRRVRSMLQVDASRELDWPEPDPRNLSEVASLTERLREGTDRIDQAMRAATSPRSPRVAPRDAANRDAAALEAALELAGHLAHDETRRLLSRAAADREEVVRHGLGACYALFDPTRTDLDVEALDRIAKWLEALRRSKPRAVEAMVALGGDLADSDIGRYVQERCRSEFPPGASWFARLRGAVRSLFRYPLEADLAALLRLVQSHRELLAARGTLAESVWTELARLHRVLDPDDDSPIHLSTELCLALLADDEPAESIHEILVQQRALQSERDEAVRRQFIGQLGAIGRAAFASRGRGGTNALTSILATLDSLESFSNLQRGASVLEDLKRRLSAAFPVWICRKQAVPFLFPPDERSFDLVIVDEATQCRVDDALPLLFRARKLMAVGDERQTGLAKNSAIDDYLFGDFDLDEHLRLVQARSMKGGGSHLFGLVKRTKQASVMLVEHYRCPPEIIAFSNRYVYDDELRVMQWTMPGSAPAVVVDHSEARTRSSERRQSGKHKGIETVMIDRFLKFVGRTLEEVEEATGERINTNTDVALCYFLLKNEPYVKEVKGEFLRKLDRGDDVLDGAGAALQGKERNYIFYLWDVTRYNIQAFRQGDDEAKRKGELNVLMSRPKRRAFHYLHRDFAKLNHGSCTVTDYLWKRLQEQQEAPAADPEAEIAEAAGAVHALLQHALGRGAPQPAQCAFDITVGDPFHTVDLMWLPKAARRYQDPTRAFVDLAGFADAESPGQEIADYYFQLLRATPRLEPCFVFLHELVDPRRFARLSVP